MAFSKAWDKKGGVKVRDLKSRPKYKPEPLKPAEPKKDAPMFGQTRKDDK